MPTLNCAVPSVRPYFANSTPSARMSPEKTAGDSVPGHTETAGLLHLHGPKE